MSSTKIADALRAYLSQIQARLGANISFIELDFHTYRAIEGEVDYINLQKHFEGYPVEPCGQDCQVKIKCTITDAEDYVYAASLITNHLPLED